MRAPMLAFDIGGSKLLCGLVSEGGKVLEKAAAPLLGVSAEALVDIAADLGARMLAGTPGVCAAGVSIPGLADAKSGLWRYACFSGIGDLPICDILSSRLGLPVYGDNDANLSAFGEHRFGLAKDTPDFLWITISNGIGAGLFLGGKPFYGHGGNAGEFGHIQVVPIGRRCGCGNLGCLEAHAAGPAIAARYRELCPSTPADITAKDIAALSNGAARQVWKETGAHLGKAIAASVNLLNLPLVVLGGGVGMRLSLFDEVLREALSRHLYGRANPQLRIEATALGYEASLIGAAAYAGARSGLWPDAAV